MGQRDTLGVPRHIAPGKGISRAAGRWPYLIHQLDNGEADRHRPAARRLKEPGNRPLPSRRAQLMDNGMDYPRNRWFVLWEPGAELLAELDPEGNLVSCNRGSCDACDADGRPGRSLSEYLPVDQWERMRHSLRKVALTGTPDRLEINIATPAGLSTWATRLIPHHRDGALESIILIGTDTTSGEDLSAALRESEDRFRSVVDCTGEGLLVEQDGRPVFANAALARLLGHDSPDDILSWPRARLMLDATDRKRFCRVCRRLRGQETGVEVGRYRALDRDGGAVPVQVRSRALRWNGRAAVLHTVAAVPAAEAPATGTGTTQEMRDTLAETVEAVARTIEKRDPHTAGHHERVSELVVVIARQLGLEEERIDGLRLAAAIHDIGKVHVPSEILTRPGPLSAPEFEIIKAHPQVGYDIIKQVRFPWPVAETILQHHERLDGSGYPRGLRGDEICFEARILAVADCIDAMTSHRPYRTSLSLDRALQTVRDGAGTLYDPGVVQAAVEVFSDGRFQLRSHERVVNA